MNPTTWTIGSDPSCDVWIRSGSIAPVHCRLTHHPAGYQLEDLGSSAGTTINQQPIFQPTPCSPSDRIVLANEIAMPWPVPELARATVQLGYRSDADFQIPHDDSVSGRHAILILDPYDQIVLIDCESTNGTWVDDQRVESVVLAPHDSFRLGVTELTPQVVFLRAGYGHLMTVPLLEEESEVTTAPRSDWWYAGVLVATLLVAGLVAFSLYSRRSGETIAAENPTQSDRSQLVVSANEMDANQINNTPSEEIKTTVDAAMNEANTDTRTIELTPPTPKRLGDGSGSNDLTSSDDSTNATSESGETANRVLVDADVSQSMHLIVVEADGHQFDFAVAWEAAPGLLITNAHVIESIESNQFQYSVIRAFDHWPRDVESTGQHERHRELIDEIEDLGRDRESIRAKVQEISKQGASESELQPLIDQWRKTRLSEHWLRIQADCYDVGWIRVASAETTETLHVPRLGKTPIQNKKRLQLRHPSIEADAAYYVSGESRAISRVGVEVDQMQITDDPSAPLSWLATFDREPDDWKYFLFDGCPVVDLRGRIAGMYRGRVRTFSEDAKADELAKFHFTSCSAIVQTIEQAQTEKR